MPLELRIEAGGTIRPFWYGRFKINGKRHCLNLGVKVQGTPPASRSLLEEGDLAFERSRAAALKTLEHLVTQARMKRDSVHLVERLYEITTGEPIRSVKLANLVAEYDRIPRRRPPVGRYADTCRMRLGRFLSFVQKESPRTLEVGHVTRVLARAFLEAEGHRGIAGKTWNDTLKLLRSTFRELLPTGALNPFSDTKMREPATVFRKPFTPEELRVIVAAARQDDLIRPIIVTAICTAMRLGDCCRLRWEDVDMERRFITARTSKTGETVSIPIFPMLWEVLEPLQRAPGKPAGAGSQGQGAKGVDAAPVVREGRVFPEQAQIYELHEHRINWRVRKIFAAAGFYDRADEGEPAQPVGSARGAHRGDIHVSRAQGLRRASVRDFHSFRVTWVTLALTAGVPLQLVQKVTGHRTTEIVLKHYFQPGREDFRRALTAAMPKLMTEAGAVLQDQGPGTTGPGRGGESEAALKHVREVVEGMTAATWEADRGRLLELLQRV